jgi:hypothetical protein
MYQKFLNHLTGKGYSNRTVEIVHETMYNAMGKAVILGILQKKIPAWVQPVKARKSKMKSSSLIQLIFRPFYRLPTRKTIFTGSFYGPY